MEYAHIKKMDNSSQDQTNSRPWLYKKGQSGNPGGRPIGSKSLKTWLKERFQSMSDEEREEFFVGMNKIDLFKMAEGNPQTDVTSGGERLIPVPILDVLPKNNGNEQNSSAL